MMGNLVQSNGQKKVGFWFFILLKGSFGLNLLLLKLKIKNIIIK